MKYFWLLSVVVLMITVLVALFPGTAIGFFGEDHVVLDEAIHMPLLDYTVYMFGQCVRPMFCRPAEALGIRFEYMLFGNNPFAFRILQMLIHLANCILLYVFAQKISRRSIVGLCAGLIYAALPTVIASFPWMGAADPGVAFFVLASILLWLEYLQWGRRLPYVAAILTAALGVLNKEVGAMILILLFLADRWLDAKPASWTILLRRYAPLLFIWTIYGLATLIRLYGFMFSAYTGEYSGMGVGVHILWNVITYTMMLTSIWDLPLPLIYLLVIVVLATVGYQMFVRRNTHVSFLCAFALLTLLPVLPMTFTATRFLYLPIIPSLIGLAIVVDWFLIQLEYSVIATGFGAFALTVIVMINAFGANESLNQISAFTRQYRLPVRPILQAHSVYAPDTLLYFIDSPIPAKILSGMMTLRYGTEVTVNATDVATPADLRAHANAYVYYFDEEARAVELVVTRGVQAAIAPAVPIDFDTGIRLEKFEVVGSSVRRGEPVCLLLYWRASQPVEINYTLFAHLTNARGEMIAGVDGQPRAGKMPTSRWKSGALIVDWVLLPVPDDAPLGSDYRLEIGWYDSTTMQRSPMIGQDGTANFVIAPFAIQ